MLKTLNAAGFLLQFVKGLWGRVCVTYLGLFLTNSGMTLSQASIRTLCSMGIPNDYATLTRFLGFAGYFRRFADRFAQDLTIKKFTGKNNHYSIIKNINIEVKVNQFSLV